MDPHEHENLENRLARLEQKVAELEQKLAEREPSGDDSLTVDVDRPEEKTVADEASRAAAKHRQSSLQSALVSGENWLNRIGIALLLLGVAFLFKYSVEQGWLIPPVRSLIGLGIGLSLFIAGLEMKMENTPLKQICLGGGIAAFYITGFATFQLYDFAAAPIVWIFMVVTTVLALSLSMRQHEPILSIVGVLGGLGTPFMLYTGSGSVTALIGYTALILSGASIIYFKKGWASLFWSMVAGGWLVMIAGLYENMLQVQEPVFMDRLALQLGVLVCLAAFWGVPAVREILVHKGVMESPGQPDVGAPGDTGTNIAAPVAALVMPILGLLYSMVLWDMGSGSWGLSALTLAIGVGYLYLPFRNMGLNRLASMHGFSALILLTISFLLMFEGELLFMILALEGLGLRILADQTADRHISLSSDILFFVTAVWLMEEMTVSTIAVGGHALVNIPAVTQLSVIAILGLAAPYWIKSDDRKRLYQLVAHLAFLGWLYSELIMLDNGQAYITVSWGAYAVILLILGFIRDWEKVRMIAVGTIFLVVAKLFLVDLAQLQAIWRILLFIGFGAVLLIISYYLQRRFSNPSG